MTSREKFEAWAKDNGMSLVYGDCDYVYSPTVWAWKAWQAAEADMAVQLANAESKCRELAAENEKRNTHSEALAVDNAALREVAERMVNQFAMSGISPEEKSINPAKSLMFDAKSALFMPATDAFLAEVRAQGVERMIEVKQQQLDGMHPDTFAIGVVRDSIRRDIYELKVFAEILRKETAQ
ncbi:hypothetical protein BFN90_06675 [Salmonella enterica]|nr:hypothetical protein [Salmonella enterica]